MGTNLQSIRVTLDFEVFDDFDVNQIDFNKVFDIQGGESVEVTVKNMSEQLETFWEAEVY